MSFLRSRTDPRWANVALSDLDATLGDHAHCEKKAAATAVKLVADYSNRPGLVRKMAKLAQEETHHFLAVLNELARRGRTLPPDTGDSYARSLLRLVRPGAARLMDRLLVCAIIEARSCERLALLGPSLPNARLRELYERLATAESGHERLFLELAREEGEAEPDERLGELSEAEAALLRTLPLEPRIH
jgi:tRNA 2-(methylsulfanyl)-N6-isopentenyladenosine37 hydroxylase